MTETLTLAVVDYVIIACMLIISLSVGIFLAIRRKKKITTDDYLLGSRKLQVFPVTLSLFVTFMSSTSLIGFPAESYTRGSEIFLMSVGTGMGYVVGIFTVVPVMHPLKVTSLYEYFHIRFRSPGLRLLVTVVSMLQKIIFTAIVLLSPALSLQTGSGLPFWVSVVIVGGVGIIYTSIGGIRGVVLVDVFQAVVITTGIAAVIIKAVVDIGGIEATWTMAKEGNRVQPVNFDPDPRSDNTFWCFVVGSAFTMFAFTFDQSAMQRVCSVPRMTEAKIAYAVNSVVTGLYVLAVCFMGTAAYSYFVTKECDPFKTRSVTNSNQLVPFFIMALFKNLPGLTGLYLAAIFSGGLSTVSSLINGLAANTIEDLLRIPFQKYNVSETIRIRIAQLAVFVYGSLCIGLAFLARMSTATVIRTSIGLVGALGGPVVGIFFLGAMVPWANKMGAIAGVLLAWALNMWMSIGNVFYGQKHALLPPAPGNSCVIYDTNNDVNRTTITPPLIFSANATAPFSSHALPDRSVYDISNLYYGLTGWLAAFIVGLFISLMTRKWYKAETEERLLFPFVRKFWKSAYLNAVTGAAAAESELQVDDVYNDYTEDDVYKKLSTET